MRRLAASLVALSLVAGGSIPAVAATLQEMIDAAPDNAVVAPPAGVYRERIVIRRPVVLDGSAGVTIDGGGEGTVVTVETSGAELKRLTIANSGRLHNQIDAAIRIKGGYNVVKDNVIENCLFGIDVHQGDSNVIRRNRIASSDLPLEMRGDAIRLWYSNRNRVESNEIVDARDFVVWYSLDNVITGNTIRRGRYGIHFMYAHDNSAVGNEIADCTVGVFLMYSNRIEVRHNRLLRSWGASGMGVGFKESSEAKILDNDIVGNAIGIYIDISPYDPDTENAFTDNRLAYNGVGVQFHNDWQGNVFRNNSFVSNYSQIAVNGGGTALREVFAGNYWDDYAGFDDEKDGSGDSPYEIYSYADRLWMEVPSTGFFRGSPALELVDFIERLAPFSEPLLLLRDPSPMMREPERPAAEEDGKSALELLGGKS